MDKEYAFIIIQVETQVVLLQQISITNFIN